MKEAKEYSANASSATRPRVWGTTNSTARVAAVRKFAPPVSAELDSATMRKNHRTGTLTISAATHPGLITAGAQIGATTAAAITNRLRRIPVTLESFVYS
jgi:hypothetical protein